jgi:hypothetical protein
MEKMGRTGGAGSCFQKECRVDFCGFDGSTVCCWVGRVSEGRGEASGWSRCAEKSLFSVFSGKH